MIVITALIAAPGLGQDTLRALIRNDVGAMFDAGIAIVILAIVLDRVTEHASERMDPRHRAGSKAGTHRSPGRRGRRGRDHRGDRRRRSSCPTLQDFPGNVQVSFREPVNAVVDWMRLHIAVMTGFGKDVVSYAAINPLQTVFTTAPFWLVVGVAAGLALIASGLREAVVAGACLVLIFLMGLWEDSMETLVQVLIATIITFAIGLAIGIGSARSDRFSMFLRPILDATQTMPSFVYILPAFVLFDASRFTAIVAAIVFAVPPVIRLVDVGLRSVSPTIKEAAVSSGASSRQRLTKVELPVARPALQLAAQPGGHPRALDGRRRRPRRRPGARLRRGRRASRRTACFGMGLAAGIALVLLGHHARPA